MTDRIAESSPRLKARMAGAFWLITVVGSLFDFMYVGGKINVPGNAAATVHNLVALESLRRLGFAADLIGLMAFVVVIALLYELLKPVNRSVSLLAALLGLVGCTVGAVNGIFGLAPLAILSVAPDASAFSAQQLQELVFLFRRLGSEGANIGMVFFGLYCVLIGGLAFRSSFIPRIIGVAIAIAGVSYLTNSFTSILSIWLPSILYGKLLYGGIGEIVFALWVLVMGVNASKWKTRAAAALER
ncbi:MAG: DUF4386 domain-containing protein [Rhizomicrobium sp.]